MEAFEPLPPTWTEPALHAMTFHCPRCGASPRQAQRVWLNRRAPVVNEDYQRKWQEFYHCECEQAWWAWSSDRPPSDLAQRHRDPED